MTTKTRIVRIGNSRGIRVPKLLLDEAGLPEEVELRAEPGRLVVRAARPARAGWAAKARSMHRRGDDAPLEDPTPPHFDETQWRWRRVPHSPGDARRPISAGGFIWGTSTLQA